MNQTTALNILKSGRNVFLTGQAGSGKTYVVNQYINRLYHCGIRVALTASTGIAATHIGGVTIHSWSGIGVKDNITTRDCELIAQKEHIYKAITSAQVLVIDEISMLSATILDNVDMIVKHIRQDYRAFGGLQVVVVGDFFQLPPVTKGATKDFAFAAKSRKQSDFAMCYLTTQYRQQDDEFTRILNELRTGEVSDGVVTRLMSRLHISTHMSDPVKLYTHNVDVEKINMYALDELQGEEVSYEMKSTGDIRFVKLLRNQVSSSDFLTLKVGAKVIFTKNNPVRGYYNGTTGVVTGWHTKDRRPLVELRNGNIIRVEPETRNIEDRNEIVASVTQLPLKLAWAITIHKSQGMTLDAAEIDLSKSFESGQAYVALSRVRSLDGLKLLGLNMQGLSAHPLVLRGDIYFQQQSNQLEQTYEGLQEIDRETIHRSFVSYVGGEYVQGGYENERKVGPISPQSQSKGDTVLKTIELIQQNKTLEEICQIRELTQSTIITHLVKIKLLHPTVSLSGYKPNEELLIRFRKAVTELSQQSEHIHEGGYVKSKSLFDYFHGELSYDMIKLCGLFV